MRRRLVVVGVWLLLVGLLLLNLPLWSSGDVQASTPPPAGRDAATERPPDCLVVVHPGGSSGGQYARGGRTARGSPVYVRRTEWTGLSVFLFRNTDGAWVMSGARSDIETEAGFVRSAQADLPHLAASWQQWNGQTWTPVRRMSVTKSFRKCWPQPANGTAVTDVRRGQHYTAAFTVDPAARERRGTGPPLFELPGVTSGMTLMSAFPRLYYLPGLLSASEADALAESAEGALGDAAAVVAELRGDKLGQKLVSRVLAATGFARTEAEPLLVERAWASGAPRPDVALDTFDPAFYGPQDTNRALTVVVTLREPAEGGDEVFPLATDDPSASTAVPSKPCSGAARGVAVRARGSKGAGVLVYGVSPNGELDRRAAHARCPVPSQEPMLAAIVHVRVRSLL